MNHNSEDILLKNRCCSFHVLFHNCLWPPLSTGGKTFRKKLFAYYPIQPDHRIWNALNIVFYSEDNIDVIIDLYHVYKEPDL